MWYTYLVVLRIIYTIFIGVLFATFVGVGVAAFYPEERAPEYPVAPKVAVPNGVYSASESAEMNRQNEEFQKINKAYQERLRIYNRNVSVIALVSAVLIVVVSLVFVRQFMLISDGLLLGGLVTLVYSIVRGFGAQDNIFRFVVVTVGLVLSLVVGYAKFASTPTKTSRRK